MSFTRLDAKASYERGISPVYEGMNMAGTTAQVLGTPNAAAAWHPTVVNLLVLIALELVAYSALRWTFRNFHGG